MARKMVRTLARVSTAPGSGLVVRTGEMVMVVDAESGSEAAVDELLAIWALATGSDTASRGFVRRLAGWLSTSDTEDLPSFAAVRLTPDDATVMVFHHAAVEAWIGETVHTISGRDSLAWVDQVVPMPLDRLVLTIDATQSATVPVDPRTDLPAGIVGGGGALITLRPGETVSGGANDLPVVGPIGSADETEIGATDSAGSSIHSIGERPVNLIALALPEHRTPLPMLNEDPVGDSPSVLGVKCKNDHFNDPRGTFCGLCGISMIQQTHNLVEGTRPPLGVLVFDDGAVFRIDSDYVLGREPDHDELVVNGSARPLTVDDAGGTVSRSHAWLHLDGWDVQISDRGSANGTSLARPTDLAWQPLAPYEAVTISPGTRVQLGDRSMVFDGHFRI